MANFATNLSELYANGNNPGITGRDREIKQLMLTLLRKEKPNAILVGEAGVGKTVIVHHLAYLIANQLCPPSLYGFTVYEVNTNALLSGDGYRGVTEKKFDDMINSALSKGKVIIFFDEFHTVENLGKMSNNSTPGLGNTLKPFLTRGDFRVIGATTNAEFGTITDNALLRRFKKIPISEPGSDEIVAIIKLAFARYIGDYKIKVDPKMPEKIKDISLTLEGNNPDKAKDLVDIIVANAILSETSIINSSFVDSTFREHYNTGNPTLTKKQEDIFS